MNPVINELLVSPSNGIVLGVGSGISLDSEGNIYFGAIGSGKNLLVKMKAFSPLPSFNVQHLLLVTLLPLGLIIVAIVTILVVQKLYRTKRASFNQLTLN